MDGIFFYWIGWMIWVYCTFIMKKTPTRLWLSIFVLVLIILSPYSLSLGIFKFNVPILLLLFFCSGMLVKKTTVQKVYLLVCTLTITIAYVSFNLFELFDPVWLFFDRKWLLSFALFYLTLMLIKEGTSRMICIILGASQGELLYGFILSNFRFDHIVGSSSYLDVIAISSGFVILWLRLENLVHYFDLIFQKSTKEKHG